VAPHPDGVGVSARDRILGRLRAGPAVAPVPLPDVQGWIQARRRDEGRAARVERLRAALLAARAEVHDSSEAAWPELLGALCVAKGLRTLLVGTAAESQRQRHSGLPAGVRVLDCDTPADAWRQRLFGDVDAALTRARSAIADTGSLVLWCGPGEPRTLSLVPPVHIVLLATDAIHADLPAALQSEAWPQGLATNVVLASGPSKTADIQQTLAYGAHGPRQLVVILLHAHMDAL